MVIEHFVVTLFSCRLGDAAIRVGKHWAAQDDPLVPQRMEVRFDVFEAVTVASMLAQTNRDFTWVILVDRALDSDSRERLRLAVGDRMRVVFHCFDPSQKFESVDWLLPYVTDSPDYLLTTNLDDDDALPIDYLTVLRNHIAAAAESGSLPPVAILGTSAGVEWDMRGSPNAPLGWKAPWHRGKKLLSAGFSLLGRFPECTYQVLGLSHEAARAYLDPDGSVDHPGVAALRRGFAAVFQACGARQTDWQLEQKYCDLSGVGGAVVVVNHPYNNQRMRLFEEKRGTEKVTGPESFPGVAVDWDRAPSCVRRVTPSWSARLLQSAILSVRRPLATVRKYLRR